MDSGTWKTLNKYLCHEWMKGISQSDLGMYVCIYEYVYKYVRGLSKTYPAVYYGK